MYCHYAFALVSFSLCPLWGRYKNDQKARLIPTRTEEKTHSSAALAVGESRRRSRSWGRSSILITGAVAFFTTRALAGARIVFHYRSRSWDQSNFFTKGAVAGTRAASSLQERSGTRAASSLQ
jgi:hypothetical protein